MGNPVIHFEVIGKDAPRLQEFFSKLFGWTINADNPMNYGIVDTGVPGGIGGGIGSGPEEHPGHVTFYIGVDDPKAYLEKAESLGGKTVMEAQEVPGGPVIAMFADPEGHIIGLVKGM
jgi:predicted enzyme related to lactoylglutathione lyase